jgi:hypothetical protein
MKHINANLLSAGSRKQDLAIVGAIACDLLAKNGLTKHEALLDVIDFIAKQKTVSVLAGYRMDPGQPHDVLETINRNCYDISQVKLGAREDQIVVINLS